MTIIGAPAKKLSGGGGKTKKKQNTTYGERDPPHGENGLYMESKDCPHRKNTPLGETPPHGIFLFVLPPPGRAPTLPPLRASIMISTHLIPFV